jgi:hypothetical protein
MHATSDNAIGVRLTLLGMALEGKPRRESPPIVTQAAPGDYRTKTESLLGKSDSALLARVWQQVFPCHTDVLPDRGAMIADLADFAEVLRPGLHGMHADRLCRLIAAYAANRRRSQNFVTRLVATVARPSRPRVHVGAQA